jgi:hypothetical protein
VGYGRALRTDGTLHLGASGYKLESRRPNADMKERPLKHRRSAGATKMKILLGLLLASSAVFGAAPRCENISANGTTIESCERRVDTGPCMEMLLANPQMPDSPNWNGCAWSAHIYKAPLTSASPLLYVMYVSVVPSFRDSEYVDITVRGKHGGRSYHWILKDVRVEINKNDIPRAIAEFPLGPIDDLGDVPIVEMTEKGGTHEMSHRYR